MYFVPSPIRFVYDIAYMAKANASGRMQYYRIVPGKSKERIGRGAFIEAYNKSNIIGLRPVQSQVENPMFQLEFYVSTKSSGLPHK